MKVTPRRLVTLLMHGLLVLGLALTPAVFTSVEAQQSKGKASEKAKEQAKDKKDAGGGAAPAPAEEEKAEATPLSSEKNQYWVLQFDPKALRMIAPKEGTGVGKVYFYLVYTMENPDSEDHEAYVNVVAESDGKKEYADMYLPSIEKAVEKKEREPLWGKTDEFEILSKRKPEDPKYRYITCKAKEKRKCVAIFNAIDPNVSKLTIRVYGLSNEIRRVVAADGSVELEERVRELKYDRAGDEYGVVVDSFKLAEAEWVKRKVPLATAKQVPAKE